MTDMGATDGKSPNIKKFSSDPQSTPSRRSE